MLLPTKIPAIDIWNSLFFVCFQFARLYGTANLTAAWYDELPVCEYYDSSYFFHSNWRIITKSRQDNFYFDNIYMLYKVKVHNTCFLRNAVKIIKKFQMKRINQTKNEYKILR
jgi:hypothetical protein